MFWVRPIIAWVIAENNKHHVLYLYLSIIFSLFLLNMDCADDHIINVKAPEGCGLCEKTLARSGAFVMAGIQAPVTKGDDLCSQPPLHFRTTN